MKKHSSKKKALLIALAVIVVLILGAVGAVYGVTHGFYRSSNYTSDEDAMKDFTNVGEDTTAEDEVNPEDFVDAAWDAVTFDDGGVYALPKHSSVIGLYYNEDLLEWSW